MVTNKTPGADGDSAARQRQQPVQRRVDGRPRRLRRALSAHLAARETPRPARRRGLPRGRPLRRVPCAGRAPPRSGSSARHAWVRGGAHGAHPVVSHGRRSGPHGVRRGLGAGHRFAGRHHERLHRGLHGRARHQGCVGRHRLLHQPREDGAHSTTGRERAVVRRPHAVRSRLPQAGSARRHGYGYRGGGRGRRRRPDHPDWREPAQRSARARGLRQQVGDALERDRGLREQHHRRVSSRVRVERRRVRARQTLGRGGRRAGH